VQHSFSIAFKTLSGSKLSEGITIQAPWEVQHITDHHPKTVIKRNGDAHFVLFGITEPFTNKVPII
jgi:hypothetical protein